MTSMTGGFCWRMESLGGGWPTPPQWFRPFFMGNTHETHPWVIHDNMTAPPARTRNERMLLVSTTHVHVSQYGLHSPAKKRVWVQSPCPPFLHWVFASFSVFVFRIEDKPILAATGPKSIWAARELDHQLDINWTVRTPVCGFPRRHTDVWEEDQMCDKHVH